MPAGCDVLDLIRADGMADTVNQWVVRGDSWAAICWAGVLDYTTIW
jgi:hypothetical protein